MNKFFIPAVLGVLLFSTTVSVKDFKPAFGKWKGTLTYLDYTSGKPYTMPCNITINAEKVSNHKLLIKFEYPDEPKANGSETIVISADGKSIGDEQVVINEKLNGVTKIIAERNGVDGNDNRKAILRLIYEFSKRSFSMRKQVKFEGEEKWILRNEFKMSR